jgi:hypothetical protein
LDSLDAVEVVMAVEEEFSIEIPDAEADNITTVQEAIDYISKTPEGECAVLKYIMTREGLHSPFPLQPTKEVQTTSITHQKRMGGRGSQKSVYVV